MLYRSIPLLKLSWPGLALILALITIPTPANAATGSCPDTSTTELSLVQPTPNDALLKESWKAYRERFIQVDGRVIDREASDRSTSEGQAYAMWRAVLINDPDTFQRTYAWAEANLARRDANGQRRDTLWSWHWGRNDRGEWTTIDTNFASDADIDAAMALILASRRWNCPAYLAEAQAKLADIWALSTAKLPDGTRQLLPGPKEAFWNQPETLILNPSYFAPYAFRLFAQVDSERNWLGLVDSGYAMLEASTALSPVGLPSDWIAYDPGTKTYRPLPADNSLKSSYSFDAFRVWWRVSLDAAWFGEPRAKTYLSTHLDYLQTRWQRDKRIPARISLAGEDLAPYEATAQYAMLYPALQQVAPLLALQLYRQKLMPTYRNGFWDNDTAYYTQNLTWFSLLPKTPPSLVFQTGAKENNRPVPVGPSTEGSTGTGHSP